MPKAVEWRKCQKCDKIVDRAFDKEWVQDGGLYYCGQCFAELLRNSNRKLTPIRHHEGKPRWDLLAYDVLNEVAKGMSLGVEKHGARDWEQGVQYNDYFAAAMRHLAAWEQGESMDESGLNHLAHAMCDIMIIFASELRGMGVDDRPKANKPGIGDVNSK